MYQELIANQTIYNYCALPLAFPPDPPHNHRYASSHLIHSVEKSSLLLIETQTIFVMSVYY